MANKNKNNTALIVMTSILTFLAVASLILLTVMILGNSNKSNSASDVSSNSQISKKSSSSSNSSSSKEYSEPEKNVEIEGDATFINDIKEYKNKSLTDTNQHSFRNNIEGNSSDGSYNIDIPNKWGTNTHNPENESEGVNLITNEEKEPLAELIIWTLASFDDVDGNPVETEAIMGLFFNSSPIENVPSEYITDFKKTINGKEYVVGIKLMPREEGQEFLYNVFYVRAIEDGPHARSFMVSSVVFRQSEIKSNREAILQDIYSLEDILGGFDESK